MGEKLLGGVWRVHLCQCWFSIVSVSWSSFVSILSVYWSIVVYFLEDMGIMCGV